MIRVACVSDVHTKLYIDLFEKALREVDFDKVDIFLFAGDMIYKGNVEDLFKIIAVIEKVGVKFPIYACFGNEEYENLYDQLREIGKNKIIFLEDEFVSIQIPKKGKTIGLIATKGSLAEPTRWQEQNFPNIREIYQQRIKKIDELASTFNTDIRILLFHYAPTFLTVVGEPEKAYPQIASPAYEKIILNEKYKIDAVFHGHAHRGIKFAFLKNRIPIYNVALPVRKQITVVDLPRPPSRGSILKYLAQ